VPRERDALPYIVNARSFIARLKMKKLIKSSAVIIAATVILKCLGLLREIILAYAFGAGDVSDAYVVSRGAVDTLIGILAGSAGAVFITVCAGISGANENAKKTDFTRMAITLFGVLGLIFTSLFALLPNLFVRLFAFSLDAAAAGKAALMLRFMAIACVPGFINSLLAANLQIEKRFFRSAVYQVTINIAVIAFIFIGKAAGEDYLIGAGYAVGALLSTMLLLIFNKQIGFIFRPAFDTKSPELKMFIALIIPSFLSVLATQLFQVIDRSIASSLTAGTISALSYAAKIENVFVALIGTAVATALMPDLTKAFAQKSSEAAADEICGALKTVIPIVLPLTAGILILSAPVIRILLERGAFGADDTAFTAQLLAMYAIGLPAQCISPIFGFVFVALRDTRSLLIITVITLVISVILKFLFITPFGAAGLALSTSVTGFLLALLQIFVLLKKKISVFVFRKKREWAKILCAAAVMSVFAVFAHNTVSSDVSYLYTLITTIIITGVSILIYSAVLHFTKSEIAVFYKDLIKSVLARRKGAL
jgi:putative peptidoglycan lipid II flippase